MKAVKFVAALLKRPIHMLANFLDNRSIRAKLFMYATVLISLMLLLAVYVLYQMNEIQSRHIPARAAMREMEAALNSMRINELNFITEADSLNPEFYLKQKSVSFDSWQENYRQFETNHHALSALFPSGAAKKDLDIIKPQLIAYRDAFLVLTGAYRERGFQSFGREGVLRQRADALQESLTDPRAEAAFLRVQEAQDRFLLYRERSSVETFYGSAAQLRAQLTKPNDRILFDEYAKLFDDVVAIYQKIGLTNNEGLRGQLALLTNEITPRIAAVEALVLQSTSQSVTSINRTILIMTLVLGVVAIVMAFTLAQLIIKRIQLLSEASKRIAAGNLRYRLSVGANDELGQLSRSFNLMAEQLQKNQQSLHERAQDLSQSVKRFELVSSVVNEAIYEWDIKTNRFKWGDGIIKVFGYKPHEKSVDIEWWTERIHPADVDAIDESLRERLRRRSAIWKKEYRFKKANSEYVYCSDRGFIEYHNGEPVRMVGSIVDISRQKALDRAKNEFISIASHQLRTPLGSIRWNLELLLEKVKSMPTELADYAQEAFNSTLRMAALVNDLLSVARIEQNRVQNIPEKTDLVTVLKEAINEMQPISHRHNVRIDSAALRGAHAEITIDPKRFREVVQNLLSNAVKYTPAKGKVVVAIENRPAEYVVSITDNGIGIPLEDQSKLFGKFYRASNVATTETEGSGLGLFVVRAYVEDWGGKVWFNSNVNHGATFYVSVPHKPRSKTHRRLN